MQRIEPEIEAEVTDGVPYIYAPPWLLSAPFETGSPTPSLGIFPYFQEQEHAILLLLLSDLQRQLLHPADPTLWEKELLPLTLDTKRLLRSIPNRHPSEEVLFWRVVSTLGYLQLLLQEAGAAPKTIPLFQAPTIQQCHGKHFEMTLLVPRENIPFLLGVYSGYTPFFSSREPVRLPLQSPFYIWKPIWLDFSHGERKWYLHFLFHCQQPDSLLDMNGAHASEWSTFFSPTVMSTKKKSLLTQWRSFQSFTRRLHDHGFLSTLEVEDSTYLPFSHQEAQIYWQRPVPTFEEQGSRYFCQRVAYLETLRFLSSSRLLTQLGKGIPAPYLKMIKEHVLGPLRMKGTKTLLSHFILLETGVLLPSILLFLEWVLRMHPEHALPLPPIMRDWMQGCNVEALFQEPIVCVESFQERLEDAPATWLSWIQELPTFTLARSMPEETVLENHTEREEIPIVVSSPPKEKLDRIQTRKELEGMRTRSQTAYLNLYKTYLMSLDPKSRQLIATIKEQLKPKAFEEQIAQRLVSYMVDHPHSWKS